MYVLLFVVFFIKYCWSLECCQLCPFTIHHCTCTFLRIIHRRHQPLSAVISAQCLCACVHIVVCKQSHNSWKRELSPSFGVKFISATSFAPVESGLCCFYCQPSVWALLAVQQSTAISWTPACFLRVGRHCWCLRLHCCCSVSVFACATLCSCYHHHQSINENMHT